MCTALQHQILIADGKAPFFWMKFWPLFHLLFKAWNGNGAVNPLREVCLCDDYTGFTALDSDLLNCITWVKNATVIPGHNVRSNHVFNNFKFMSQGSFFQNDEFGVGAILKQNMHNRNTCYMLWEEKSKELDHPHCWIRTLISEIMHINSLAHDWNKMQLITNVINWKSPM